MLLSQSERFEKIAAKNMGIIRILCRAPERSQEDQEDLIQAVLIKAWQNFESFDPSIATFGAWVGIIARSAITDARRRKQRRLTHWNFGAIPASMLAEIPSADQVCAPFDLGDLTENERKYLVLNRIVGFTSYELSEQYGLSPSSVRNYICQATAKLRRYHDA